MLKRKIYLQLVITAVLTVVFILSVHAGAVKLANRKLILQKASAKKGALVLKYLLAGKSRLAAVLAVTLKSGDLAQSCSFTGKRNSGKLIFADAAGRKGSFSVTLDKDNNYIKLQNFKNINLLEIFFSSNALLLPDDISEDTVIYPQLWKQRSVTIPGDFYLAVNMLDKGKALFSTLWNSDKLRPVQYKNRDNSLFSSIVLQPDSGSKIWLGVNAADNIWYQCFEKLIFKPQPSKWRPPFAADWKMTLLKSESEFKAESGQNDTWPMPVVKNGKFVQRVPHFWFPEKQIWYSTFGWFSYPIVQHENRVELCIPKYQTAKISYSKEFKPLIYPLAVVKESPAGIALPFDMRQKLLPAKLEKRLHTVRSRNSYNPPTCGVTHKIEKIFYREEEKKSKKLITKKLSRMDDFVRYELIRMNEYLKWGEDIQNYLKNSSRQTPSVKTLADSLLQDIRQLEEEHNARREKIKDLAYCRKRCKEILKLVDAPGDAETKEEQCKQIGRKIRVVGGNLDHLLGDFQNIVKALRLRITALLLDNPPAEQRKLLEYIRTATAKILHDKFPMEGKSGQRKTM